MSPRRPAPSARSCPEDWDTLILKSLSKDPRRRFQSMKEMKRGIEELGTQPASRPSRLMRKPWYAVATAVVVIAVVLGSLLGYSSMSSHASAATLSSYLSGAAAQGRLSGTVLVAKHGKVILDHGYGMANRAAHIPNGPNTEYGLADATTTAFLTADTLQVAQPRKVYDWISNIHSRFCAPYFAGIFANGGCPEKWRKITVADLVDGTSAAS